MLPPHRKITPVTLLLAVILIPALMAFDHWREANAQSNSDPVNAITVDRGYWVNGKMVHYPGLPGDSIIVTDMYKWLPGNTVYITNRWLEPTLFETETDRSGLTTNVIFYTNYTGTITIGTNHFRVADLMKR